MNGYVKDYLAEEREEAVIGHQQRVLRARSMLPRQDLIHLLRQHHKKHRTSSQFRHHETARRTDQENSGIHRRLLSRMRTSDYQKSKSNRLPHKEEHLLAEKQCII
jgi:hypothetical protein